MVRNATSGDVVFEHKIVVDSDGTLRLTVSPVPVRRLAVTGAASVDTAAVAMAIAGLGALLLGLANSGEAAPAVRVSSV